MQERISSSGSNLRGNVNQANVNTQNINARNLTISEINNKSSSLDESISKKTTTKDINQTIKIEGGGEIIIKHKIEAPPGVNVEYIDKLLNSPKNAEDVQKSVIDKLVDMGVIPNKPK
jgi:hypothetical protein